MKKNQNSFFYFYNHLRSTDKLIWVYICSWINKNTINDILNWKCLFERNKTNWVYLTSIMNINILEVNKLFTSKINYLRQKINMTIYICS